MRLQKTPCAIIRIVVRNDQFPITIRLQIDRLKPRRQKPPIIQVGQANGYSWEHHYTGFYLSHDFVMRSPRTPHRIELRIVTTCGGLPPNFDPGAIRVLGGFRGMGEVVMLVGGEGAAWRLPERRGGSRQTALRELHRGLVTQGGVRPLMVVPVPILLAEHFASSTEAKASRFRNSSRKRLLSFRCKRSATDCQA